MKTIYFIRHAKSSWTDFSLTDFERPLDQKGQRDAPYMAELLKSLDYHIDKIITSSAVRAKKTATFFGLKYQLKIEETKILYHAEPESYLDLITEQAEDVRHLALFGHNPGLTYLANMIRPGCTDNIPTCGIVIVTVDDEIEWSSIQWENMHFVSILTPKDN